MIAAINDKYGAPEVLQLRETAQPEPKPGEILIKIHATAVNSGDVRLRRADPFAVRFFFGLFKPKKKILGNVFSGVVAATGDGVTAYKPGDAIFGSTEIRLGAWAQYLCLPAGAPIALKPANLSHEEAAVVPFGGMTALHFLKKAGIASGQKILIYGASGAVGIAAVQLAKYFGAEVTAVCGPSNLEMVKSAGADKVLNYAQPGFSLLEEEYDLVYETVNKAPVSACLKSLKKGGTLILGAAMLKEAMQGMLGSLSGGKKLVAGVAAETSEYMQFLKNLIEEGSFKPFIDKTFTFEQIAEANRYVDAGHKKGNVAVRIS